MPKRKKEDKITYYRNKLRRLEEKTRRRSRHSRVVLYSDSSDDDENYDINVTQNNDLLESNVIDIPEEEPLSPPHLPTTSPAPAPSRRSSTPAPPPPPSSPPPPPPPPTPLDELVQPELAPEYLLALGDPQDDAPGFGEIILPDLAQRWLPLLRKGMPKEAREKMLKEFLIPENCKLLRAPSMNTEISAAVSEALKSRDKKLQQEQQQLGAGITAVNRAMTSLLTNESDKIKPIKLLSDACRILSDLHFINTDSRIKLLSPNLDRSFLSLIQNEERDDLLFGNNLTEKIKAAKTIEKQGLFIKKTTAQKTSAPTSTITRPRQGNWTGPPRSSWSRGGRGGGRTSSTQGARRPPPPPPPPAPAGHRPNTYNRAPRVPSRR